MAATITTNGRKKISTFKREFSEKFPYLTIQFLDQKRKEFNESLSLSAVRIKKGSDISISGQNKINSLEGKFEKMFGISIEVCYSKGNKLVRTKSNNEKTLNELNKWCKSNGCELFVQNSKVISKENKNKIRSKKTNDKIALPKNELEFEEDKIIDIDPGLIEIKKFIKQLRKVKKVNTKFEITIYTEEYSYFTSLVTFKIKGKELLLRRTNWYNDSYWNTEANLVDTLDSLSYFYDSESDPHTFLNLDNWQFAGFGELENGYNLELINNEIPLSLFPKNVFDKDGELNLYKLHNEIEYKDIVEEVVIDSPQKITIESNNLSLEIDIPSLDYSDREYINEVNVEDDSSTGLLSVEEQLAALRAELEK